MNMKKLNKEMTVYDLAGLMMTAFESVNNRIDKVEATMEKMRGVMATKDDLEKVKNELKKEFKKDIADTNKRLDNMRLYIPSVI